MFTYYPPYNLGISPKFRSKEFVFDLHGNSYRDIFFFQLYFYDMVHREKKELTGGGALGGV